MKVFLVYEPHGLKYSIDIIMLPRVGDTVKNNDLTYIVKEVEFNYDKDEIRVNLKRPDPDVPKSISSMSTD